MECQRILKCHLSVPMAIARSQISEELKAVGNICCGRIDIEIRKTYLVLVKLQKQKVFHHNVVTGDAKWKFENTIK